MGAAEGVIIDFDWVMAAVDAHLVLGFDDSGGWWGGLDVADAGVDTNALVRGRGSVVKYAEEWGERDPGVTARRAFATCKSTAPITLQYDSIGVGTNVKSEINRLREDEGEEMSWLTLVPWDAGGKVLDPGEPVLKDDDYSPTNKNYFENFKAQAWWTVAQMFYRTYRAVRVAKGLDEDDGTVDYTPDQLISLDSTMPQEIKTKLMRELSQAVMVQSRRLKLMIDKAPEGAKSPNLADALIMGRYPARGPIVSGFGMIGSKVVRA